YRHPPRSPPSPYTTLFRSIRDTPISETGFIGAGVGAAMAGMRPVVELMFVDFFGVCMDAIYNLAAKNTYFSGANCKVPMVIMTRSEEHTSELQSRENLVCR